LSYLSTTYSAALSKTCFYVLRTSCVSRLVPMALPLWDVLYKIIHAGAPQMVSITCMTKCASSGTYGWGSGRSTRAVINAQSNCISPQGGKSDFKAAEKGKGRKRSMVVDTMSLVIELTVTAAS
jgi:hypothetical protein